MSKGLFEELIGLDIVNDEIIEGEQEPDDIEEEPEKKESANIPIVSSPVYPRIFWGDSAKPLAGQFPNSEYVDDNIHTTYQGLLSYYG